MTELISPFRKSSYSGQEGNCVEVAATVEGGRAVRDSKNQAGPVLFFTHGEWQAFLAGTQDGAFSNAPQGWKNRARSNRARSNAKSALLGVPGVVRFRRRSLPNHSHFGLCVPIHINNCSFAYQRRIRVLRGMNLAFGKGATVLLGPNGAGKSTVLGLAASALLPASGSVVLDGLDTRSRREVKQYRRKVGWLPQRVRSIPGLRVREQVAHAGWLKGMSRREAWDASLDSLRRVDLAELADRGSSEALRWTTASTGNRTGPRPRRGNRPHGRADSRTGSCTTARLPRTGRRSGWNHPCGDFHPPDGRPGRHL